MNILIATPCYGGLMMCEHVSSLIKSINVLAQNGIQITHFTIGNDSFISKARNKCASLALSGGFDKLVFIDADVSYKPEQLLQIVMSNKDIVGGTYPTKRLPIDLNYGIEGIGERTLLNLIEHACGEVEIEVKYVPTGFLAISRNVLEKISENVKTYTDITGAIQWEFFPSGVRDGKFETEDYGFCSLAHDQGFKTHLNTNCIVNHTGSFMFTAYSAGSSYER